MLCELCNYHVQQKVSECPFHFLSQRISVKVSPVDNILQFWAEQSTGVNNATAKSEDNMKVFNCVSAKSILITCKTSTLFIYKCDVEGDI